MQSSHDNRPDGGISLIRIDTRARDLCRCMNSACGPRLIGISRRCVYKRFGAFSSMLHSCTFNDTDNKYYAIYWLYIANSVELIYDDCINYLYQLTPRCIFNNVNLAMQNVRRINLMPAHCQLPVGRNLFIEISNNTQYPEYSTVSYMIIVKRRCQFLRCEDHFMSVGL